MLTLFSEQITLSFQMELGSDGLQFGHAPMFLCKISDIISLDCRHSSRG
jgi:hypothetical protein